MRVTTINVQITKQAAPAAAPAAPKTEEKPAEKEFVKFGSKRLQQIVARIEKTPERGADIVKSAHNFYDFDEESERVLALAIKLNK